MPAYLIVETDITDPEQYEQYKAASPGAVAAGGGRFVVRGGELAVLEGDWDAEAARRPRVRGPRDRRSASTSRREYQAANKLREGAANLNMVAVEGRLEEAELLGRGALGATSVSSGSGGRAGGASARPSSSGSRAKSASSTFSIAGV